MIGVYVVGSYNAKDGEAVRNMIMFHQNETEEFEAIKFVGEHPNKAKVIEAYKAKGIKVIDDVRKKEEIQEAQSEQEDEVKPIKRGRKFKGE